MASSAEADFSPAMSSMDLAELTFTELGPSWVLSRRSAVLAAVSFSKVTVADLLESAELDSGVTERDWILPL